jgi:hypothetical protein
MAANEVSLNWKDMAELLRQLEHHCDHFAVERIVQLITEAPTGFSHSSAVCDLVDLQQSQTPLEKIAKKVPDLNELPVAIARIS